MSRALVVLPLLTLLCGCAARFPPAHTFDAAAWSRVEAIAENDRVEVRYVSGSPPLRYTFEGTFRRATAPTLEIETKDGLQRLVPQRVLRVAVGERESRVVPLGILGGLLGAVLGGMLAAVSEVNDDAAAGRTIFGALFGVSAGLTAGGAATRDRRPVVIYSRGGSL